MLEKAVIFVAIFCCCQAWNFPTWNFPRSWNRTEPRTPPNQIDRGLHWTNNCDDLKIQKHDCAILFESERCHGDQQNIDKRYHGAVIQITFNSTQ